MQRPYTGKWLLLPAILIALCFLTGAFAQETTAGLLGIVKDPSGASVAKANIEVTGANLIGNRKVQTDDGGNFRIAALPPGSYTLWYSLPGFTTVAQLYHPIIHFTSSKPTGTSMLSTTLPLRVSVSFCVW